MSRHRIRFWQRLPGASGLMARMGTPTRPHSRQRRIVVLSVVLASVLGCTNTVVERSARAADAGEIWQEQMDRAARFHRKGLYASADRYYEQALKTSAAFREGDSRIAETLAQRAELRLSRGHYEAAEADYRAIVALERAKSAGPNPALANAINNLAVFYIDLGRIREAEALLAEAIEIRTAIYGDRHVYVAVLLQNLGDAKRRGSDYRGAEEFLIRALSIYAVSGDASYREASVAQNNLARVYRETGQDQKAEKNHLNAIRLSIRVSGERNTDVGVFSRDLATLYTGQRRFSEAESLFQSSISILREGLGDANYQLSKTYRAYSAMLTAAGRSREAAEYDQLADATGY